MTGDEETLIRADERARVVRLLEKIAAPYIGLWKSVPRFGRPFVESIEDAIEQVRTMDEPSKPRATAQLCVWKDYGHRLVYDLRCRFCGYRLMPGQDESRICDFQSLKP